MYKNETKHAQAEMYAGRVAWCPLVSGEMLSMRRLADRRTPNRYIMLTARCDQHSVYSCVNLNVLIVMHSCVPAL